MADSTIAISAGTGTALKTFLNAATEHVQYVRPMQGTSVSLNNWTISATASTSQIAADASRVAMLMVVQGSVRVYVRFDSTAPTSTVYHWYLDPNDRWEVPDYLCRLAVSVLGEASPSGALLSTLFTAA